MKAIQITWSFITAGAIRCLKTLPAEAFLDNNIAANFD
jgi:hypothetical protein